MSLLSLALALSAACGGSPAPAPTPAPPQSSGNALMEVEPQHAPTTPPGVLQVAARGYQTCAVKADHTVACWGANDFGQLGDGTRADRGTPVAVHGVSDAESVAVGLYHACALLHDGSARCWGENSGGQLGDGSRTDRTESVAVAGLGGVRQLALGSDHTCALLTSGGVVCWGRNDAGQLGDGGTTDHAAPAAVAGLEGVQEIAAGAEFTCARSAHAVSCWGDVPPAAFATPATSAPGADANRANRGDIVTQPTVVPGGEDAVGLTVNASNLCVQTRDGAVRCLNPLAPPAPPASGAQPAAAAGNDAPRGFARALVVAPQADLSDAVLGAPGVCLIASHDKVRCPRSAAETDVTVPTLGGVVELAAGEAHWCARARDGSLRCWGENQRGQLGIGGNAPAHAPTLVDFSAPAAPGAPEPSHDEDALVLGVGGECLLTPSASLRCDGGSVPEYTASPDEPRATDVAIGTRHACALRADHSVICWGANDMGQLGIAPAARQGVRPAGHGHPNAVVNTAVEQGGQTAASTLVTNVVAGLTDTAQIVTGEDFTCARTTAGAVLCWGRNDAGQLGDGTTRARPQPRAVAGITGATEITAGTAHACARLADGAVKCWGDNGAGQLGDGSTTMRSRPVAVAGLTGAEQLASGAFHTCARKHDGSVACWGRGELGELGDGTTANRGTAVAVHGVTGATDVRASGDRTCARSTDGALLCWGDDEYGQLGDGASTYRAEPVEVAGLAGVAKLFVGPYDACARAGNGVLRCWGARFARTPVGTRL